MNTEKLRIMHEFQFKSLTETVNMLMKLVTFYFAIIAASVAYVLTSTISTDFKKVLLIGGLLASALFIVSILSLAYGVVTGLSDVNRGLKSLGRSEYQATNMQKYMQRGRNVSIIVLVACVGIVATLCAILFQFLFSLYV